MQKTVTFLSRLGTSATGVMLADLILSSRNSGRTATRSALHSKCYTLDQQERIGVVE
jgi:hypothetical protein